MYFLQLFFSLCLVLNIRVKNYAAGAHNPSFPLFALAPFQEDTASAAASVLSEASVCLVLP